MIQLQIMTQLHLHMADNDTVTNNDTVTSVYYK